MPNKIVNKLRLPEKGTQPGKWRDFPVFWGNVLSADDACPSNMEFFGNVGDFKHKNRGNYV